MIAEAVGIARGTAYKYLVEMAEKNMIEYDGQEIRTNVTRNYSGEQTQTPLALNMKKSPLPKMAVGSDTYSSIFSSSY